MKKYLELKDISAYRASFDLSNYVWDIVIKWNYFAKDTVGKQLVKEELKKLPKEINSLIEFTNEKLSI